MSKLYVNEINEKSGDSVTIKTNDTTAINVNGDGIVTLPKKPHIRLNPYNSDDVNGIANAAVVQESTILEWSNDRVIVPVAGLYLVCLNFISDSGTGREDAHIVVNGSEIVSVLSSDNGTGYRQKNATIVVDLDVDDYVQFSCMDWYNISNPNERWRTASMTLLG